jgi:hypothetical protein
MVLTNTADFLFVIVFIIVSSSGAICRNKLQKNETKIAKIFSFTSTLDHLIGQLCEFFSYW